jgi:hypothetical protein
VLEGRPNPCVGIEPPGDRNSRKSRRKTFLYPREAAALLACEAVPLEWREVYALALYTYLRPGELRVLTWEDVDFSAAHIRVTKAWDYADEKIKTPKTRNGVRTVPIADSGHRDHRDRFIVITRIGIVIAESERSDVFGWFGRRGWCSSRSEATFSVGRQPDGFLRVGPFNLIRCAVCTTRSRSASAIVGSPT